MIERAVVGLLLATVIALVGRRAGWLAPGGAAAAVALGTITIAAGWSWGALLILFFVAANALSVVGGARALERTAGVVAKLGARDAWQVLANGGVYALAALLAFASPWAGWRVAGAGALAAAAADTWGTELGALARTEPRLVTTGRRVPPGTSGAVTALGLAGTLAGAAVVAGAAWALRWGTLVAAAAVAGGVAGALADSLVGALWQERRRCPACGGATEQRVHRCGAPTVHAGGVLGVGNDAVNALAAVAGAAVALLAWRAAALAG